jgi:endo-1,4-beta-xylanase
MKSSVYLTTVLGTAIVTGCWQSTAGQDGSAAGVSATATDTSQVPASNGVNGAGGAGAGASGNGVTTPNDAPTNGTSVSGGSTSGATNGGAMSSSPADASSSSGAPNQTTPVPTDGATSGSSASGTATSGSATSTATGSVSTGGASTGGQASNGAGGSMNPGDDASGGTPGAGGATVGDAGVVTNVKKFIGNISPKNQDIPADFADHWMQVTMEANSKWGFVQPNNADEWVWEPVDQAYQYAKDHGIVFKEHCFFWNFEQPSWVTASNVATVGPAWVKAFCERYPDVEMIDVVNEFLHNKSPYREGMGGAGVTGHDWVIQAYQWAREYCPNSTLILNDFNIIEYENDHNSFVSALHALLDAGAPIDAIGAQAHDVYKVGSDVAKGYLDHLVEEFHLPIYITEVDIDLTDDAEQLASMQEEIQMFWDHPSVHGITYWGFLKGSTWRTNAWLIDGSGNQRPAMTWLQDFIATHR